jgi:hypothetical protein
MTEKRVVAESDVVTAPRPRLLRVRDRDRLAPWATLFPYSGATDLIALRVYLTE